LYDEFAQGIQDHRSSLRVQEKTSETTFIS
jgi:hypothetical protein